MSNGDQHQFKDRYMLRLPDGMRDRIKAAAEANGRSMNSEIIDVLSRHYTSGLSELPEEFRSRIENGEHPLTVWREYRGLGKSQLAKIASVDKTIIFEIEQRHRFGNLVITKQIADALGITVDDLI